MNLFFDFFTSILLFLDSIFANLGVSIIVFTVAIRLILLPLTLPSVKSSRKIQELQPELNKLKEKHGKDKQALALAQAQLYKSYNINPLAGCLPQLFQFFILIVLYQSMIRLFNNPASSANMTFLWANLGQPDSTYLLPIIAGVTQFLLSIMLSPATQTRDLVDNNSKLKTIQEANKKEEDVAEMAATMQQQMVFLMPVMTIIVALRLPSGLALYWIAGTVITIITQYFVSGWGGLARYWNKYVAGFGPLKGKYLPVSNSKILTKIPDKIYVKKSEIFTKSPKSDSLASVLKNINGSSDPVKPRNKRATKMKKNLKQNRQNKKKNRK